MSTRLVQFIGLRSYLFGFTLITCLGICAGCARYQPQPLDPQEVELQIQHVSINDLISDPRKDQLPGALNPTDGLDADEIGWAALLLNPALKAKRLSQGVAEGQIITAGLFPNPSIDNKSLLWSHRAKGGKSVEGSLAIEVLRWGERAGERQAKVANAESVRFDIMAEEWKTISEARLSYWNVVAQLERQRLNKEALELSERLLSGVRTRVTRGASNAFDRNLVELQHLRLLAETQKADGDLASLQRALRQVIGVPFDAELKLSIPEKPLARTPRGWSLQKALSGLTGTAQLKTVEWRYQVAEGELRAAIARQYPGLRLGPSGTFDFDGHTWSTLLGFVANFDIPIFDRNQGQIREKFAERDLARAEYVARLQAAQADLADAVGQLENLEKQLLFQEKELLPKAMESVQFTEKAYAAGDVDGTALLQAQTVFIESKKSYLELLIEYRRQLQAVEMLLGRRLGDFALPATDAKGGVEQELKANPDLK